MRQLVVQMETCRGTRGEIKHCTRGIKIQLLNSILNRSCYLLDQKKVGIRSVFVFYFVIPLSSLYRRPSKFTVFVFRKKFNTGIGKEWKKWKTDEEMRGSQSSMVEVESEMNMQKWITSEKKAKTKIENSVFGGQTIS